MKHGPRSTKKESTADSVPSCAARTMASCPLWSRPFHPKTTASGSKNRKPKKRQVLPALPLAPNRLLPSANPLLQLTTAEARTDAEEIRHEPGSHSHR